jgi:phage major head subunit gpT-like protein
MDINSDTLAALNRTSAAVWNKGRNSYTPVRNKLAMPATTTTGLIIMGWLGALPYMKPFIKQLEKQNVGSAKWQIDSVEYAAGWDIPRLQIKRDQHGLYAPLFEASGLHASFHPDQLLFARLVAGFTEADYTGSAFFAASGKKHVPGVSKNSFGNKLTKQLTAPHFATARKTLNNILGPDGVPFNAASTGLTLVCGETWRSAAEGILEAEYLSGGGTNVNYKKADLLVTPLITGDHWFLINSGSPFKPMVDLQEIKTEFTAMTDPKSPNVFEFEAFSFKSYGVYSEDYGLPQTIVGSTGADA